MSVATFLYPILAAGAEIMASSAATEFAKGAGKSAYEAIKARLQNKHKISSVKLLEDASENPDYAEMIKADLDKEGLESDATLKSLADQLLSAIESLPQSTHPTVAIDAKTIRAKGNQIFKNVEGIRAVKIVAGGDQTFENIPAGKA